jgi:carotenoid 1,2-hydratase
VGSVFSPYYAWAGRRDPDNHCAINVALYGPGVERWSMTERGRGALARDAASLAIGPSALSFDGAALTIDIAEIAVPLPRRLQGRVRLLPTALPERRFTLDAAGRHRWMPIAPTAHVEVDFSHPACRWRGHGYCDTNAGDEPLHRAFTSWDWSRADVATGTAVLYDMLARDGARASIAVRYDKAGRTEDFAPPPRIRLKDTLWRLSRQTQADPGQPVVIRRTLEDTPFYARSELTTHLLGETVSAMHESLSLDRLDTPIVRAMLPFRMPRRLF